jgi:hypothetical protein
MAFDSPVAVPPTSAYGPKDIDFSWLADLPNRFFQGQQNRFQQQQNQRTTALQKPVTQTNTQDVLNEVLKRGGAPYAEALLPFMLQQEQIKAAGQPDPMLQGLPGGGAQPPQPQISPAPAKTPATVRGGDQAGSIVDIVTAKIPQETAGPTIAKIAQLVGVDPNAALTPGQQIRVNGLVQRYAQTGAAPVGSPAGDTSAPVAGAAVSQSPSGRVDAGFTALPPSAGNVSAAAQPRPQALPQGQPQSQQGPQAPAPAQPPPQAAPAPPQQQPLVPQVPLPQGFSDPQQAILALEREASLIARQKPDQAAMLQQWAKRIEASTAPVKVAPYESLRDPRTGQVLTQGAMAQMATNPETSATLDADAERYRQTGTLPPNMGRGIQGQQQATAIRTRAVQMEVENGGEPADWPERWQQFQTTAAGRRVLANRAAGLTLAENEATSLLPRVREASARVSRTEYPTLNTLIEAAQKGTGGTNVIKLGIAISSLIPVYARVLKPTGQITEGDTSRAREILDKAWSDGQINAALDQMEVELKSARTALDKTTKEYATKKGGGGDTAPQAPATPPASSGGNIVQWVRRPDGSLGPAQ